MSCCCCLFCSFRRPPTYVSTYLCMYVCMYAYYELRILTSEWKKIVVFLLSINWRIVACMYVCMYVCINVCMYVCMYICMYVWYIPLEWRKAWAAARIRWPPYCAQSHLKNVCMYVCNWNGCVYVYVDLPLLMRVMPWSTFIMMLRPESKIACMDS